MEGNTNKIERFPQAGKRNFDAGLYKTSNIDSIRKSSLGLSIARINC